jgi:hypothetical protein
MGNVGWEAPIKEAMKTNAREAKREPGWDGYCPVCDWPLVKHKGKKVCNFCTWEGDA